MDVCELLASQRWILPLEEACCLPQVIAAKRAQICNYAQFLDDTIVLISLSVGVPMDARRWDEWPYETASAFLQWVAAVHHELVMQLFSLREYHPDLMRLADYLDIVGRRHSPLNERSVGMPYFFFKHDETMSLPPTTGADHVLRMELAGAALQDALAYLATLDRQCWQARLFGGAARDLRWCLLRKVPETRLTWSHSFLKRPAQHLQDDVPLLWRGLLTAWPRSFQFPPVCSRAHHIRVYLQLVAARPILRALSRALLNMERVACRREVNNAIALLAATRYEDVDYLRFLLRSVAPYRQGSTIFFPGPDDHEDLPLSEVEASFRSRMFLVGRLGQATLHITAMKQLYKTSASLLAASTEHRIW